jgi:prepilin-type N-terminal cleavage/methylation domain-containing protein
MAPTNPIHDEQGFGLVELLISMTVLSVGLLGLFATFATGFVTVNRANMTGNATVLADRTMETFRGGQYSNVAAGTTTTTYSATSNPASPDGRTYVVVATVSTTTATNTSGGTARTEKLITITVTSAGQKLATESSTFDSLQA